MNTIDTSVCPRNMIIKQVIDSLNEDLSTLGDKTASLIRSNHSIAATVVTNDDMIVCGQKWVDMAFFVCDPDVMVRWHVKDGDVVAAGTSLCEVVGNARAIMTAERTALNFLHTLSGTATIVRKYVNAVSGTQAKIMDTRKTLPGLRLAQKYAVTVGGGYNQRMGLYDAVLIKENHIMACGGITAVLAQAFATFPKWVPIQIEVETLDELAEAIDAGAKNIMLDNMTVAEVKECVEYTNGRAELEVSGNVNLANILEYANTGVDRISIGAITKNVQVVDLSLRVSR